MKCAACGGDNREGANFCRHCGIAMAATALPERPEPVAVVPALPAEGALPVAAPAAPPEGQEREAAGAGPEAQEVTALPGEVAHPSGAEVVEGVEGAVQAEMPLAPEEGAAPEERGAEPAVEPGAPEAAPAPIGAGGLEREPTGAAEGALLPETQVPGEATIEAAEGPAVAPVPVAEAGEVQPAEPMMPLAPGTVVADRYLLLEAGSPSESEILYTARDLCRCWQCGFEGNAPDDAFCAQCGASLGRKPTVRLLQVRDSGSEPASGEAVVGRLAQDGLHFLLLAEAKPEASVSAAVPTVRLIAGQRSDVGGTRELNEDSLLVLTLLSTFRSETRPNMGLYAVADGMGGHEGGEVASRLALQILAERVAIDIFLPELAGAAAPEQDLAARLAKAAEAANDAVYLARQKREIDMGTTLTAALVRDNRLLLAHVGDSRAYRWSLSGLEQLTTDHSVVASMIAAGRATPEEVYTHPQRSVIYRCIGDRPVVQVDTAVLPLAQGDRLIVCSDGLWEMIRSAGIEDVMMQEADPQTACDVLTRRANAAGGEDNISVIVVQVGAM